MPSKLPSWLIMMSTPAPAKKPVSTELETYRMIVPNFSRPKINLIRPLRIAKTKTYSRLAPPLIATNTPAVTKAVALVGPVTK